MNGKRGLDCRKTNKKGQKTGVGIVSPIHLQLNEWLTIFFRCSYGAISQGFATLLRMTGVGRQGCE